MCDADDASKNTDRWRGTSIDAIEEALNGRLMAADVIPLVDRTEVQISTFPLSKRRLEVEGQCKRMKVR